VARARLARLARGRRKQPSLRDRGRSALTEGSTAPAEAALA
jgi:hypothetical protein